MAAEIPALKVSRDSAVVSSSGSWFHSLILDRKKDSLHVYRKKDSLHVYICLGPAVWDSVLVLVASCSSS